MKTENSQLRQTIGFRLALPTLCALALWTGKFLVQPIALAGKRTDDYGVAARLVLTQIPSVLLIVLPAAVLFGVLFSSSWLGALKRRQAFRVVTVLGLFASLTASVLCWFVVPRAKLTRRALTYEIVLPSLPPDSPLHSAMNPSVHGVADMSALELQSEIREARRPDSAVPSIDGGSPIEDSVDGEELSVRGTFLRQNRLRVALSEFHRRLAIPLASLLFAVLGLPLGIRLVRQRNLYLRAVVSYALSIPVFLVYWAVHSFSASFGILHGWEWVWAANLVTALLLLAVLGTLRLISRKSVQETGCATK